MENCVLGFSCRSCHRCCSAGGLPSQAVAAAIRLRISGSRLLQVYVEAKGPNGLLGLSCKFVRQCCTQAYAAQLCIVRAPASNFTTPVSRTYKTLNALSLLIPAMTNIGKTNDVEDFLDPGGAISMSLPGSCRAGLAAMLWCSFRKRLRCRL